MAIREIFLCCVGIIMIKGSEFDVGQYKDYLGYISNITEEDKSKTCCDKCVFCWRIIADMEDIDLCKVNCSSRGVPHIFCKMCILQNLEYQSNQTIKKCPICRSDIYSVDILLTSIESNDVNSVQKIIISGVDINAFNLIGRPAFVYACEWNRKTIAEMLIINGSYIDAQDRDGNTALMYSARNNHLDIVESLIRMGANIDIQNKIGDTALICAVKFDNFNMAKLLIELGHANANIKNLEGNTALICAAKYNNFNMSKLLIEIGKVDINVINESGDNALSYARMYDNSEIIEILV